MVLRRVRAGIRLAVSKGFDKTIHAKPIDLPVSREIKTAATGFHFPKNHIKIILNAR
jgi:hypothetical protein